MTLLRRFPALVFALALVAIAGFCVATESFGLLVVAGALAAMSWYVTEGPRGRTLPRWVSNLLLLAAVLNIVAEWVQHGAASESMGAVGRFALWLTIIKLYEAKGVRDYGQLLALTAVLMTAGALQTVQLSFAILLLAYVVLGLIVVLLFQLYVGYERARASRRAHAPEAARFVPPLQPVSGAHLTRSFAGLGAAMAMAGLAASVFVFVVFPRGLLGPDAPLSGLARHQSGYAREVRLNEATRISESRREVFTVAMLDPRGHPIQFPEPLRMRGAVLDRYSPMLGRWVASRSSHAGARAMLLRGEDRFVPLGERPIDDRTDTYTQVVTMRSMATDTIFSSYAPIAVAGTAGREIVFEPASLVLHDRRTNQLGNYARYAVRVQPYAKPEAMAALVGQAGMGATPAGFPYASVVNEAKRILRERGIEPFLRPGTPPEERWRHRLTIARAFMDELHSPRFRYTTDLSGFTLDGGDPTVLFLTKHRFGHCEHFAAAMVALCRSVGVEARLVTGFIAMEYDEAAQHYVVRESNAHVWVEVRSGEATWATFDPTPPETLEALNASRRSWFDSWRWIYDRIEFMWNNRFVGFDATTQATLAERVSDGWRERVGSFIASVGEAMARLNAAFRLGPAGYIWLGLVGMVAVLAVATAVVVLRRLAAVRRLTGLDRVRGARRHRLTRELGFYVDALAVLARAGLPKPEWQSPMEYALAVGRARPGAADAVRELVEAFYWVRYGGAELDSETSTRLRRQVESLGSLLRER